MSIKTKLVATCVLFLLSIAVQAQDLLKREISVTAWNVSVEEFLKQVEKEGEISFSYSPDILPVDSLVQVTFTKTTIGDILKNVFGDVYDYKENHKHIIILKSRKSEETKLKEDNTVSSFYQKLPQEQKNKYKISGIIYNELSNEPIAEAQIIIDNDQSYTSNTSGLYKIEINDDRPLLRLKIHKEGFQGKEIVVEEGISDLNVSLKPIEKTITLTKSESPNIDLSYVNENPITRFIVPEAQRESVEEAKRRPFQISFVPMIGTNMHKSGNYTNAISVNILAGYSNGVSAFEFGGFANIVRQNVDGFQFAGFSNVVGGDVIGGQFAGFNNHVQGSVNGVQFAGFNNMVSGDIKGIQLAGFNNVSRKIMDGVQMAGFNNIAMEQVLGMQVSGFNNLAFSDVSGAQISGFSNISRGDFSRLQAAGFMNISNKSNIQAAGFMNMAGKVNGMQLAGFMNMANRVNALQAAGFMNIADTINGAQMAGFMNISAKTKALQAAGFMNISDDIAGAQLAGFMNIAKNVKGAQIAGFINIADSVGGVSIAFLSFVKNGFKYIEISNSEMMDFNFAFKTGVRSFYNIISLGYDPFHGLNSWSFAYGLGSEIGLGKNAAINLELTAQHINEHSIWTNALNEVYRFETLFSFYVAKRLAFFGGPSINLQVSNWYDRTDNRFLSTVAPYSITIDSYVTAYSAVLTRGWFGWKFGIRI